VSTGFTSTFAGNSSNYSSLDFKDVLPNGGINPEFNTIHN